MRRLRFAPVVLMALFLFGQAGSAGTPTVSLQNTQNAVTLDVTPRPAAPDGSLPIEITLTTHSQELNDDLLNTAVLVTADGLKHKPAEWKGDPPGGHHRKGVLLFKPSPAGKQNLELIIQRPGESQPRRFRWQSP
jgi:hypothetical protein